MRKPRATGTPLQRRRMGITPLVLLFAGAGVPLSAVLTGEHLWI